jgi:hypothetical protein
MTEQTQEAGAVNTSSSRACAALTASGRPCRAVPMPGQPFCLFHSQQAEAKQIMADARRAGGLARLASLKPTGLVVRVGTPQECKETARQALQLMLDGKLDRPRCDSTVNGCAKLLETFALGELQAQIDAIKANLKLLKEELNANEG